jgi:hypothetical protein
MGTWGDARYWPKPVAPQASPPGWGAARVGAYAARLRERGKPGGIIITALARRANKIAFAMVRDQTLYDPACWPLTN